MDGGAGLDTLSYASSPSAVTVNLGASTASGGGGNDSITNFENIMGTSASDSILGSTGANWIISVGGADTLDGGLGNDTITGVLVTVPSDVIGAISYSSATGPVTLNLTAGSAIGGGGTDAIQYQNYFKFVTGSSAGDSILGYSTDYYYFFGGEGNDTIDGSRGQDTIDGGPGNDSLVGTSTQTNWGTILAIKALLVL